VQLLAPRPTLKLNDHPLSAVRSSLFNIFSQLSSISGAPSSTATWGRTTLWWQWPIYQWHYTGYDLPGTRIRKYDLWHSYIRLSKSVWCTACA